jgi:hypothetical protein
MRKLQAVRPYYEMEVNKITGLIKTSWFDGLITQKLKGILHKGKEIITRINTWQLGKAGTDFVPSLGELLITVLDKNLIYRFFVSNT